MSRLPRLVELVLAIALCALVAFWGTRLFRGASVEAPPTVQPAGAHNPNARLDGVLASARLFGSRPPGALSDNVRALGVVADAGGNGSVVVSVDGQPAKVYRVGDTLDGRLVAAIGPDRIELEAGGARQVFRLPLRPAPATGVTAFGSGVAPGSAGAAGASPYAPPPPAMAPQVELPPPPGVATTTR